MINDKSACFVDQNICTGINLSITDHDDIQFAGVQYILDSVIKSLLENPARRFIYVEVAYMYIWWGEQSEETRNNVAMLVREGMVDIVFNLS